MYKVDYRIYCKVNYRGMVDGINLHNTMAGAY